MWALLLFKPLLETRVSLLNTSMWNLFPFNSWIFVRNHLIIKGFHNIATQLLEFSNFLSFRSEVFCKLLTFKWICSYCYLCWHRHKVEYFVSIFSMFKSQLFVSYNHWRVKVYAGKRVFYLDEPFVQWFFYSQFVATETFSEGK